MSSNLVIVAIPDQNDQVWKVSSEKIPHLTLLFLGDSGQVSNLDQIMLFVEHAASTSLKRFYLPVDYRGELGADKADVLFFKKGRYDFAAVRDFRSLLLKDTNIKTAYDSAKQFEEPKTTGQAGQPWIPHLTLGYPKALAKSLPNDEKFYDVSFNRIAVWTGDFEGPEFLLKDYWEDLDEMDIPMDVAMSDLQHHGVKGMKWGVRKEQLGQTARNIRSRNADRQFKRRTKTTDTALGLMNEARNGLAKDLPEINARHKDLAKTKGPNQNLNTLSRVPAQKAYKKEVQNSFLKHLNAAAESKTNPSGTKKYTIESKSATRWKVKLVDVAHADISEFEVEPVFDSDGFIIDIKLVEEAMSQTAELGEEFLAHLSEEPWSNFTKADYTTEQWHAACLIHTHDGAPTSKNECKLPVKTPDGALNRNGVHAAAAALAGARGGLKGVSDDQKKKAAGALRRYYAQLDEDPPESLAQSAIDLGSEFVLEHFGVKGMRWGVRKEQLGKAAKSVGKAAKATGRAIGDVGFEANLNSETGRNSVNMTIDSKARKAFKRTDLPALKERHGDYGKLRNRTKKPFSKEARAYRKDARETYIKRLEDAANSMTNISGTRQYTIRERGWELPAEGGALPTSKHYWSVTSREIKHADGDFTWDIEIVEDNEGYITDLKPIGTLDSLAQGEAFVLEHFGIKGMHWGQRKAPPTAVNTSSTSVVPHGTKRKTKIQVEGGENHPAHADAVKVAEAKVKLKKSGAAALSNQELRDMANRLQLENQVALLTSSKGKQFVSREFETTSKQLIKRGTKQGAKRYGPTVAKKAGKAAATAATIAVL